MLTLESLHDWKQQNLFKQNIWLKYVMIITFNSVALKTKTLFKTVRMKYLFIKKNCSVLTIRGKCWLWQLCSVGGTERTVVSRYPVKHPDTERKDKFQHLANNNITLFPPQLSCHMHFYLLICSFLFHFLPVKGNIILSKFLI